MNQVDQLVTEMDACQKFMVGVLNDPSVIAEADITEDLIDDAYDADLYRAINTLRQEHKPISTSTIIDWLNRNMVVPPEETWTRRITRHTNGAAVSRDDTIHYSNIMRNRKQIAEAAGIIEQMTTDMEKKNSPDGLGEHVRKLMDITTDKSNYEVRASDCVSDLVDYLSELNDQEGSPGIPTGLVKLDNNIGGYMDSDLYIIAGRPGMGKTAFALNNMAHNLQLPSGLISTEQPRKQIMMRLAAILSGANLNRMRLGKMTDEDWKIAMPSFENLKSSALLLNDKPTTYIDDVMRQARRWKFRYGMKILFVDYLQRIKVRGVQKEIEAIGICVRELKNLARELDIPVVCLSQLNRGVESREDKRPRMSDLRGSGEIEQEADCIMSLYRNVVYYPQCDANQQAEVEISALKVRNGQPGLVRAEFQDTCIRFNNYNPGHRFSADF